MKYFYAIAIGIVLFLSHDVISQVGYLSFVCDYSIINVKTQLINWPYDTLIIDNSLVLTVAWRHFCDTLQEYMLYCIIYIKTFIKQNMIVNHFFLQLTNLSWTFHYLFIRPSALILLI